MILGPGVWAACLGVQGLHASAVTFWALPLGASARFFFVKFASLIDEILQLAFCLAILWLTYRRVITDHLPIRLIGDSLKDAHIRSIPRDARAPRFVAPKRLQDIV